MAVETMVLYGKNSILERLKADPRSIIKIFVRDNFEEPELLKLIQEKNIPVAALSPRELDNMRPEKDLQGIVARVSKFEYRDFGALLKMPEGGMVARMDILQKSLLGLYWKIEYH